MSPRLRPPESSFMSAMETSKQSGQLPVTPHKPRATALAAALASRYLPAVEYVFPRCPEHLLVRLRISAAVNRREVPIYARKLVEQWLQNKVPPPTAATGGTQIRVPLSSAQLRDLKHAAVDLDLPVGTLTVYILDALCPHESEALARSIEGS